MDNLIILIYGPITAEEKATLSDISKNNIIERRQLTGGEIITEAFILTISPLVIKGFKDILLALINKKRDVSIKYGDVEIKNIDHTQVNEIISNLKERYTADSKVEPNRKSHEL